MITLNTTFHVEDEINIPFINYMRETYFVRANYESQIVHSKLSKIHSHRLEEGHSYSVQFTFNKLDELEKWDKTKGRELNEELIKNFDNKLTGFSTLLEEIEL